MKLRTIKRIFVTFCVNHILAGTHGFELKRKLLNAVGYELGEGTKVVGPVFNTGTLKTGRDCWLGKELRIQGNGSVSIGDNCDIAPEVTFLTGGHAIGDASRRADTGEVYHITVGNGTWIGGRATIGRSVEIGSGCVVAACACVMKNVPPDTLVGGVPANVIKELDDAPSQAITE